MGYHEEMPDLFGKATVKIKLEPWPDNYTEIFWDACWLKTGKAKAMKALEGLHKRRVSWAAIIDGVRRYGGWLAEVRPGVWRPAPKHPATWLNGECWNDELPNYERKKQGSGRGGRTSFGDIALASYEELHHGRR